MLGNPEGSPPTAMTRTAILIVAAGKGERSGRTGPKQFELLAGRSMLRRSVEAFAGWPIRVVIGAGQEQLYRAAMGPDAPPPIIGGARRQDSVRLGNLGICKLRRSEISLHSGGLY